MASGGLFPRVLCQAQWTMGVGCVDNRCSFGLEILYPQDSKMVLGHITCHLSPLLGFHLSVSICHLFNTAALISVRKVIEEGSLSCHCQMAVMFSVLPADVIVSPKPYG